MSYGDQFSEKVQVFSYFFKKNNPYFAPKLRENRFLTVLKLKWNINGTDMMFALWFAIQKWQLPEFAAVITAVLSCVYELIVIVKLRHVLVIDGGLGNWTEWTKCSASCGEGFQERERSCNNPVPENGGASCPQDELTETRACKVKDCPGLYLYFLTAK